MSAPVYRGQTPMVAHQVGRNSTPTRRLTATQYQRNQSPVAGSTTPQPRHSTPGKGTPSSGTPRHTSTVGNVSNNATYPTHRMTAPSSVNATSNTTKRSNPFQQDLTAGGFVGGPVAYGSAADNTDEEAQCLATVSATLAGIVDEAIAFSRETELEAMELLDLAVEVLRGAAASGSDQLTNATDEASHRQDASIGPPVISSSSSGRRIGYLWQASGIVQTIGRLFSPRLTIGSKLRVAALRTFIAILHLGSEGYAAAMTDNGHNSHNGRPPTAAARADEDDAARIYKVISEAFECSTNYASGGHGGARTMGNPFGISAAYSQQHSNSANSSKHGIAYSLAVLAGDSTGSTSDLARSAAAEALLIVSTAWPFVISSALIPVLQLSSPSANLAGIGGFTLEQDGDITDDSFSFRRRQEFDVEDPTNDGRRSSQQRSDSPSLGVMLLLSAVTPDAIVSSGLRVQLCALVRIVAKHGPQLLLSSGLSAKNSSQGNNSKSALTAVQRIVVFVDPATRLSEPLTIALKTIETVVNHGGSLSAEANGGSGLTGQPMAARQFSLSTTSTSALQHHVRCVVLMMDTLTDLISFSASTFRRQDWSVYWTEVAEVPAMAAAFTRTMDMYLAISTRGGRDLPPALPGTSTNLSDDTLASTVAGEIENQSLAATTTVTSLGTRKGHQQAPSGSSSPSQALTAINEGLLFTSAVSLAKTAILLEGQFNYKLRFPTTGIDGFTPQTASDPPPLMMFRLLAGIDQPLHSLSASSLYAQSIPSARIWESYFLRAADFGYFPSVWYKAALALPPSSELADPTRHHRGLERLRLVRFALSHAFTVESIQILESVMGGNGFQHTAQAISLAQQRLREQPAAKAKMASRDIFRDFVERDREPSARGSSHLEGSGANTEEDTANLTDGGGELAGGVAVSESLVRTVVTVMDTCTEALLVEAALLLGVLFAKSPSTRAVASYYSVGYESWAMNLATAVESVAAHPKVVAGTLQYMVLVDSCQCILNDGEQASYLDRFDAKRIGEAIVREQEKRRLMAEAEEEALHLGDEATDGELKESEGEESNDEFASSSNAYSHHRRGPSESLSRCGSKYHARQGGSGPATPHSLLNGKRPPPFPTNSFTAHVFDLDLRTVRFLLTRGSEGEPSRVFTRRVGDLCAALATEVIVCATKAALITGPQQLKIRLEQRRERQARNGEGIDGEDAGNYARSVHGILRSKTSSASPNVSTTPTDRKEISDPKRALTPHARATALMAQKRPMQTNYDQWVAQRATTPRPTARKGTMTPRRAAASVKTVVGPITPHKFAAGKEPFVPTSTAPKRQLTPSVLKMPHMSLGGANNTSFLSNNSSLNNSGVNVAAAFGVPQNATSVQQLMTSAEGADPIEYLSVAILMHLPISFSPHYQRAQKATVRHIKSPEGVHYVQPIHRNAHQSWSASDVFIGEVYVLFLPFHRITFERLTEEVETVQRHLLDVKKKLVTTPSTQRSRRWFLSDMLNYVLPKTELLLTTFRSFLDRYSINDVLYQLSAIRVADEAHLQSESVFGAAVESADVAMPREVLRLSSGRFKDVLHSGNLMFAIGQLRDVYQKKEAEAALGTNKHNFSPTRMREIELEIDRLQQMDADLAAEDHDEVDVFSDAMRGGGGGRGSEQPSTGLLTAAPTDPASDSKHQNVFLRKQTVDASGPIYKDPYSVTDLRRFVDTAYGGN